MENTSTSSGGDDVKEIKRKRLNISESPIIVQKGSGKFKLRLRSKRPKFLNFGSYENIDEAGSLSSPAKLTRVTELEKMLVREYLQS